MIKLSMSICQQTRPLLDIPTGNLKLDRLSPRWQKKVIVIMGATGTGKSRLSIDLATQFPAEIINSDKMQIYKGLDVVTNKITDQEKSGIPHHLLGVLNPNADFTATDFCDKASPTIDSISSRGLLPIIVGGSNTYVEALVDDQDYRFRLNYECCFLWVDVALPVLHQFVSNRVDQMVENGLLDEVRNMFDPDADYSKGIRRSIGVPELDSYFREEPFLDGKGRAKLLQEAIKEIKSNTRELARKQLEKIGRLRNVKGWNIHRVDATEVFRKRGVGEAEEAWEKLVARPSSAIVRQFLYNFRLSPPPANAAAAKEYMAQCLVS